MLGGEGNPPAPARFGNVIGGFGKRSMRRGEVRVSGHGNHMGGNEKVPDLRREGKEGSRAL